MSTVRIVWLLGVWMLPLAAGAQGVDETRGLLTAMRDAYERLDYATAEQRAREALSTYERLTPDQLVRAHSTLGLILHARNEPLEAREHFAAALSLDPALRLDPVLVSPKTLEFFESLRADVRPPGAEEGAVAVRYVQIVDPRPAATLRSLAVPGWGQLHKGEHAKGWGLVVAWGVLAGGTATTHLLRSRARQDYLDATDDFDRRYNTYNAWNRARNGLAAGAGVVWAYAVLDALILRGKVPVSGFTVAPAVSADRVSLSIKIGL